MKRLFTLALALAALVANSKASPIISEFLASNAQNLATADDKTEDWIEIQNTGDAAINLAGYHLTDDPEQPQRWAIPAVDLAPGAFLVVFASGDDLKDVAADLHTNFRLNREGGYLALTGSNGAVVAQFVNGRKETTAHPPYLMSHAGLMVRRQSYDHPLPLESDVRISPHLCDAPHCFIRLEPIRSPASRRGGPHDG